MEKDREEWKKKSKERLRKIALKKIQTTMIGAISILEEEFGQLWAHGKNTTNKTEEEMRSIWTEVRKKILDIGNNQMSNLSTELNQYEIDWQRYQYTILFKDVD